MGILPRSGPLGSGPTGLGSGFSVMPAGSGALRAEIFILKAQICTHLQPRALPFGKQIHNSLPCISLVNYIYPRLVL